MSVCTRLFLSLGDRCDYRYSWAEAEVTYWAGTVLLDRGYVGEGRGVFSWGGRGYLPYRYSKLYFEMEGRWRGDGGN